MGWITREGRPAQAQRRAARALAAEPARSSSRASPWASRASARCGSRSRGRAPSAGDRPRPPGGRSDEAPRTSARGLERHGGLPPGDQERHVAGRRRGARPGRRRARARPRRQRRSRASGHRRRRALRRDGAPRTLAGEHELDERQRAAAGSGGAHGDRRRRCRRRAASAAAGARVLVAHPHPPALVVAPRHHRLVRVVAPHVLDVAVVGALAGHLAQVPADAARRPRAGVMAIPSPPPRARARSGRRCPPFGAGPGEQRPLLGGPEQPGRGDDPRLDAAAPRWSAAARAPGSPSPTRATASRITMMISTANSAARMPSTVELVTTACIVVRRSWPAAAPRRRRARPGTCRAARRSRASGCRENTFW